MEKYKRLGDFLSHIMEESEGKITQQRIDTCNAQMLIEYRKVAAFAAGILSIICFMINDERVSASAYEIAEKCKLVFKDDSLYFACRPYGAALSEELKWEVEKAQNAVARAGNFCNNLVPGFLPEGIYEVVLECRNICDALIKRKDLL